MWLPMPENTEKNEVEIAEAIVEKRNPRFKEGEIFDPVEKDILVEREVTMRENRRTAQRSWRKMGRQIRGHLKPNTLRRRKLVHVEVSNDGGTAWTKNENKEEVESHLIDRNVEQFSHAGNIPFGYTALGKELGHTGDSDMAESILNDTLEHECMDNEAICKNRWTVKTTSNNSGNFEANRDNRIFPILFQIRP
jgi:hypothetical protein